MLNLSVFFGAKKRPNQLTILTTGWDRRHGSSPKNHCRIHGHVSRQAMHHERLFSRKVVINGTVCKLNHHPPDNSSNNNNSNTSNYDNNNENDDENDNHIAISEYLRDLFHKQESTAIAPGRDKCNIHSTMSLGMSCAKAVG